MLGCLIIDRQMKDWMGREEGRIEGGEEVEGERECLFSLLLAEIPSSRKREGGWLAGWAGRQREAVRWREMYKSFLWLGVQVNWFVGGWIDGSIIRILP